MHFEGIRETYQRIELLLMLNFFHHFINGTGKVEKILILVRKSWNGMIDLFSKFNNNSEEVRLIFNSSNCIKILTEISYIYFVIIE